MFFLFLFICACGMISAKGRATNLAVLAFEVPVDSGSATVSTINMVNKVEFQTTLVKGMLAKVSQELSPRASHI